MVLISLIVFLGVIIGLTYHRVSSRIWIPSVAILLLGYSIFHLFSAWFLLPCWLIFIATAILFTQTDLRQRILTKPFLIFFRKVLPPMSRTEREALEAGDVWWESDLFRGNPNWRKLLSITKPQLTTEEQAFLDNQVETLCSMLDDWQIVHFEHDLPQPVWDYLKKERFFGLCIPCEYGGHGFSALAHSTIIAKIATRSSSAAVNTMVPNSLGPAELLLHYGTTEQKKHYLSRLSHGTEIPCFALTGPQAGSDASAIPDTGIVCKGDYQGKEVIGLRLNWDKRYITLAPIATVLGLAFKMYDPDKLLGGKTNFGITVCLIPTNHPGVEFGTRHAPMNMVFMNGPIRGKDVFIPLDWIIGGPDMAGQGWRMLMECLAIGRSISLPALSTASAQVAYRTAGAYSRIRKQFKMPIGKFEGIEEALGPIGGYTYILNASRVMTAWAVSQDIKPSVVSAIAKYHMTEIMRKVVNHSMDIHGGRGIQAGPRNYLINAFTALPIAITVEGANILTRSLIIFGQGAMRCHPYIREEMEAAADPDTIKSLKKFDKLLCSHIAYIASNKARTFILGLGGVHFLSVPVNGETTMYYRQLTRMSSALAWVSDIAMLLLGGQLKRKEGLSARLGDVLSHLYLSSAVLKYYQENGQPTSDLPYVHWALQNNLYQIQIAFEDFFNNFPNRLLGRFMRFMVFPLGHSYKAPSDKLNHQIASSMMERSELRDRMTECCYLNDEPTDVLGRLEHAFNLVLTT
ncbi:MAG: acyl-CoA dehydrogenase, partial [Gammaproteobacteria bacterium]